MLNLDPAKVLVVLVVALVVLGPDKLPRAARQLGALWNQLRRWRARLEAEVRGSFPDLPAAHTISEAVRSPLAFLDRLADEHGDPGPGADRPGTAAPVPGAPAAGGPGTPAAAPGVTADGDGRLQPARPGGRPPAADPSMN